MDVQNGYLGWVGADRHATLSAGDGTGERHRYRGGDQGWMGEVKRWGVKLQLSGRRSR